MQKWMKNTRQGSDQFWCRTVVNGLLEGVDVSTCRKETPITGEHDGLGLAILEAPINGFCDGGEKGRGKGLSGGLACHLDEANGTLLIDFNGHPTTSQLHVHVLDLGVKP